MGALDFGEIRLDNGVITIWNGVGWRPLSDYVAAAGTDEVFIGPDDPGGTYELWFDTDEVP